MWGLTRVFAVVGFGCSTQLALAEQVNKCDVAVSLYWPLYLPLHHGSYAYTKPILTSDVNRGIPYQALIFPLSSLTYAPSVQAGAFFPDWGNQCTNPKDDDGEAAHWPPFLMGAAEHTTSHYGHPGGHRLWTVVRMRPIEYWILAGTWRLRRGLLE